MAFKLPKFDLTDAKTRITLIFGGLVTFIVAIYVGFYFFGNERTAAGPSHVAVAPGNLQSVPGGQLSPEYYRAVVQANDVAAKEAKLSGGSAVPTLLNQPGAPSAFQQNAGPSCNVACPEEGNVENDINELVKNGKLSAEEAKNLKSLAKKNVSVSEYAAALARLVKQGKLTPEQARKLLDSYKKQHENSLLQESGAVMDRLIASGQLPVDVANSLLELQKKNVTPAQYAQQLAALVKAGKISPEVARQLLAQYTEQHAKTQAAESVGQLKQLAASGQIAPEVADELAAYQARQVSGKEYEEELQHLVKQGKLTPEQAARLLADYQQQTQPDVAKTLADDQKRNVSLAQYEDDLQKMVDAGKLTPQQKQDLLEQYRKIKAPNLNTGVMSKILQEAEVAKLSPEKLQALKEEAKKLAALQESNASVDDYGNELKQAVAAGILTPEQAERLLNEYKAAHAQQTQAVVLAPLPNVKGAAEFAELQKKTQAASLKAIPEKALSDFAAPTTTQFTAAQLRAKELEDAEERKRLQTLMDGMSREANGFIDSWQPPVMAGKVAAQTEESNTAKTANATAKDNTKGAAAAGAGSTAAETRPLIKAGTIIYGTLDTAVNSDYPDSPVLVTIVDGPFKGAKLLGKLAVTQGQDRIGLSFKLMNMEEWAKGKTVNAFAIDPDTAKTALASNVNYHYFLRYGTLFASSFLTGYANAIGSSGATTSLSVTGSTTTNPVLSPSSKLLTGLGQVGKTFGSTVQNYTTTPPTVKIDPGVSLGILFMADVS